jgi:hypothetical protein
MYFSKLFSDLWLEPGVWLTSLACFASSMIAVGGNGLSILGLKVFGLN